MSSSNDSGSGSDPGASRRGLILGAAVTFVVLAVVLAVVRVDPTDNVILTFIHNLPLDMDVVIWLLVAGVFFVLVALPITLMLRSEPVDMGAWRRAQSIEADREVRGHILRRLRRLVYGIDTVNRAIGQFTAWLALIMVLVQFFVVIIRYVFSFGSIQMQESIQYMHGLLFMLGAGYALLHDGHVRVDIFYESMRPKRKALVNLAGVCLFLLPLSVYGWSVALPYVVDSWRVLETSAEPSGLPFVYLFKSVILVFLVLVPIQGIAMAIRSTLILLGQPTRQTIKDGAPRGLHDALEE